MAATPSQKRNVQNGRSRGPRGGGARGGRGGGGGRGRWSHNASTHKNTSFGIEPGMRGVLVTCIVGKEGQAIRELYNVFAEYSEKLPCTEEIPKATVCEPPRREGEPVELSDSEDDEPRVAAGASIEDSIKAELAELNERKAAGRASFRSVNTSTDCVVFMQCRGVDPVALVHKLLTDVDETQVPKTRFAQRFVPFAGTCRANINDIKILAQEVLAPHFHQESAEPKTFKIIPKIRHCGGVDREEIIKVVADVVGSGHKAEMENAELVILVEAFRNICGMSVVSDYIKLKKYNVFEILREPPNEEGEPQD